jgi:heptosyltransferase II
MHKRFTILILQSGKLGDMVCTTPMFRAIKQSRPDAHLIVMGSALNCELLAGDRYVDELIPHTKTHAELRGLLVTKHVDAFILTSPNPRALLEGLLARVHTITPKIRGGYSPYATKSYRMLSLLASRVPMRFGHYIPREYLRLLEPLGIQSEDTRKELEVAPQTLESMRSTLKAHTNPGTFLVGISPGVGNDSKTWPPERFAQVAAGICSKHKDAVMVLIGGERDKADLAAMNAALPLSVPRYLPGQLSLEELKALIAELDMFIAVDTGPIYIAEAFGTPTIDIVGPMDEREQPPRGPLHRVVVPKGRTEPALHILNTSVIDLAEAERQALAITVGQVLDEAEDLITSIRSLALAPKKG